MKFLILLFVYAVLAQDEILSSDQLLKVLQEEQASSTTISIALGNIKEIGLNHHCWLKTQVPTKELLSKVILPWHIHQRVQLVDPRGESVEEIASKFLDPKFYETYKCTNEKCLATIEFFANTSQDDFGALLVSEGINTANSYDYGKIQQRSDSLYHVDGLHRLVGLSLREKRGLPVPEKLEVYVAKLK